MLLQRIKALCTRNGITIYRLERDLDFGNGTIRSWEDSTPGSDKLKKVADYFHVTVDELMKDG